MTPATELINDQIPISPARSQTHSEVPPLPPPGENLEQPKDPATRPRRDCQLRRVYEPESGHWVAYR